MRTQAELDQYYSIDLALQIKFKSLGHRKEKKKSTSNLYTGQYISMLRVHNKVQREKWA